MPITIERSNFYLNFKLLCVHVNKFFNKAFKDLYIVFLIFNSQHILINHL